MELGNHLGFAGITLALVGLSVTLLWPQKRWIGYLSLVAAIVLLVIWGALALKEKRELEGRTFPAERSFLSASLVIDSAATDAIQLHFLLTARGPQEITVLRTLLYTDSILELSGGLVTPKSIPPNSDLSLNDLFFRRDLIEPIYFISVYSTKVDGTEKTFTVRYRFPVRSIDLHPQTLYASSRQETEGDSAGENLTRDALFKAMSLPIGSLTFWFQDTRPLVIAAEQSRKLYFDPQSRMVYLVLMSGSQLITLKKPLLKPKDGMHFIAASWDNLGHVNLYVDGSG